MGDKNSNLIKLFWCARKYFFLMLKNKILALMERFMNEKKSFLFSMSNGLLRVCQLIKDMLGTYSQKRPGQITKTLSHEAADGMALS